MNTREINLAETVSSLDRDTARGKFMKATRAVETAEGIVAWMKHRLNEAESLLQAMHHKERRAMLKWMAETDAVVTHPDVAGIVEHAEMMARLANE